jgi:hypothetical protein
MTAVTFPDSGHTYSDDGSTDRDMLNGGHALWFLPMTSEAIAAYIKMAAWILEQRSIKLGTNRDATSAANSAADALAYRNAARDSAEAARVDAARLAIPLLAGNGGRALVVAANGLSMAWGGPFVRQGGGIGQLTNQVYFGWSSGGRLKVTVDNTDLGNVVMDDLLNSVINSLQQSIATKANALDTQNGLSQKANQSDLNNTNNALATKASQDSLSVTNNTVAQKADTAWVSGTFANRSLMDYGGVGSYTVVVRAQAIGDVVNLPGLSGTWRCMSGGTGGAGNDHLFCRIA